MTQFVTTTAIREAVKGREENVLDGIGVDWRAGRPHINCPYPDHADDNASWRWDTQHAKARCTCAKGDSIFDVVMKVEGRDFEAAKLRVAEVLNLPDLIRTKGEGHGGDRVYQATDAASLLNAPADRRDDSLPVAYIAHRLGVAMDAVPIPSTAMVGLKSLGYYDAPPPRSKTKPKLVGEFPCAVFGTIAADGRTHAPRIYLAAGGSGKADLGVGPTGKSRDPKKSAKTTNDVSTAGCAVLWGDPNRAAWVILAEGIETAAAIALSFQENISASHVVVAAAISATGLEAFLPYPATERVTVAADRDEAPKGNGKPASKRGEEAARNFGLKHHEQLNVSIAMPGDPGESVDWLDVLVQYGSEVVRAGILAAAVFQPTGEEQDAAAAADQRDASLAEIEATYPGPLLDGLTFRYGFTAGGKIKLHKIVNRQTKEGQWIEVPVPLLTPFSVIARLRLADVADAYGLRCLIQDMNGRPRGVDIDRATLARAGAADIRAMLFAAGLRTENDGEIIAVQCLKAADPVQEILVVQRPGWHEFVGFRDPAFTSPGGLVIGLPAGLHVELATAARMAPDIARAGTMEGWYRAVEAAVSVAGCEHWTLGVLAAFAGPIVALTGLDTCGINFSGMSSSGKSTAQRLAVSAWSTPDIRRPGLFQSARVTDNSVEALAQRGTGTVLALDDIAHVSGKTAAKMIYTIASGVGKRRMASDAQVRPPYTWTTFAMLSGESSLEEKIRGDGGEGMAGMAVRIVDIDMTGVNRQVDPAVLRVIGAIEQNYGHAGPEFVRLLVAHDLHRKAVALRERVLKAARELAGGAQTDSATVRAALPLALLMIGGELAKNFNLIPATTAVQDAVTWGWDLFRQSSDASVLDPEAQVMGLIRTWIAERWGVTVKTVDAETGVNNRETIAWYDQNIVYIPKERLREAAGNGLRESQVASVLDRRGMLAKRTEKDRLYVRYIPKIGRLDAYALRRSEFGRSDHTLSPGDYTVHDGGRRD